MLKMNGVIAQMLVRMLVSRIEVEEVQYAMNLIKIGKASGPSGVDIEMFKAGGG